MTSVLAPVKTITLQGLAPDVIQSCVLAPAPPAPDPEPADAIYAPVAPGITYAGLPVVPAVVDTSPDQIIGCCNDVGTDPQGRLNALFPAAISGDGVVDRASNDIWVFDGATWNNVGPTPGPTLTVTSTIPPWNEIVVYDTRVRTRLEVNGLAYALELLTEPAAYGITVGITTQAQRVIKVPVQGIDLTAYAPSVTSAPSPIYSAVPTLYTGTGSSRSIASLPWSPSMVWIKGLTGGTLGHVLTDIARGPTVYWLPNASSSESTDAQHVTNYDGNGFTVGTASRTNGNGTNYISWSFPPVSAAVTNTSGSTTSTVRANDFYSIALYAGAGTDRTFGHGLAGAPELVIIKARNSFSYPAAVGGSVVGANKYLTLNSDDIAFTDASRIKSTSSTTVSLGSDGSVNGSGINYVAYSFRSVPRACKIGTYTGDGDVSGQFIDCGFKVEFLIVKSLTVNYFHWLLIDSARGQGNERLHTLSSAQALSTNPFYELTGTGFKAMLGDSDFFDNMNANGTQYMYVAFASVRPTILAPLTDIAFDAFAPTV